MSSYSELLKHPHWQRKRLKILNRSNFECQNCDSKDKTLHVHHGYYQKGLKPWQYPDESLFCLCADCHVLAQELLDRVHKAVGMLGGSGQETLLGFASGLLAESRSDTDPIEVLSSAFADGIGALFGMDGSQVIKSCRRGSTTTVRRLRGFED